MDTKKIKDITDVMSKMGTSITGRRMDVKELYPSSGEAAYHVRNKDCDSVRINFREGYEGCTEGEKECIVYGLFVHETMHALLTDSDYVASRISRYPKREQYDRHAIWNIVEDPAIEYFAVNEVSDTLYSCLRSAITFFYGRSPQIQECGDDAYLQFTASLVMFGDWGCLKGRFTFPEAEKCFKKAAPIMLEAIEEADARRRFALSQEIFEISYPLWEEHNKSLLANQGMSGMLGKLGVSRSEGTGSPVLGKDSITPPDSDDAGGRRRRIVQLIESDSAEGEGQGGEGPENGGAAGETQESADSGNGSASGKAQDGAAPGDGDAVGGLQDGATAGDGDAAGGPQDGATAGDSGATGGPQDDATPGGSVATGGAKDGAAAGSSGAKDAEAGFSMKLSALCGELGTELSDEPVDGGLSTILQALRKACAEAAGKEEKAQRRIREMEDPHLEVKSPYYSGHPYKVVNVTASDPAAYRRLKESLHTPILNFRSQLKKIFNAPSSKKEFLTSGKLDVGRYSGRKITARVFCKNRRPDCKSDMAVVLLIDQSGSMKDKMGEVKKVCTIILESFAPFGIPIKIIGFFSSESSIYYHYGGWENNAQVRERIPSLDCYGGTFLGHALRYAGGMLKKRPERNKLFIVVTDGEANGPWYGDRNKAISDCHYANAEIRKFADVIGIGLYNDRREENVFSIIFGNDGICLEKPSDITYALPKRIRKILSR